MTRYFLVMTGVLLCLTMTACGTKSDSQKAIEDTNKSIEQTQKNIDKTAEDAKQFGENAQEDARKANESTMDIISSGGQPGSISLLGAMVGNDESLDPRVAVKMNTGKSWKGIRPEVKEGTLVLNANQTEATTEELEKLKDDNSFVNFGCKTENRLELKGLQETQIDSTESTSVLVIKVNTVLICGENQIKKNMTLITAKTVMFSNVQQEMIGALDKTLSITAQELTIEGENSLVSKGKNGTSTILQGPSIYISTGKLSGDGKLDITSEGSNYLGESK